MNARIFSFAAVLFAVLTAAAVFLPPQVSAQSAPNEGKLSMKPGEDGWISLFNGKDLAGWKVPNFGGEADVTVEDGIMTIGMGAMVSGIALNQDFPFKSNFEIEVTAMRTMGSDFYAAITCPVGADGFVTFINGGWGGSVFGFSSINGFDASENETMELLSTKANQWYTFRVKVYDDRIEGWMDDKLVTKAMREGNTFTTRFEVDYSKPVGVTNYCCETKIKSIRCREIKKESAPER